MAYQQHLAAIDVGSSKIAVLVASINPEEDDNQPLRIIGAAKQASRGIRKAQIINIEEAVASILKTVEAAERMAGFSLKSAAVNIGGNHISSLNSKGVVAVARPEVEITEDDVARVIEAARAVSLPTNQQILHVWPRFFTIDSQEGIKDPIGMSGVRLEVDTHIITTSSTAVKNLTKSINDAGLDIDQIVFTGLASALSTLSPTERELGVILADIGADTTSISVYVESALSYSTVVPIGGRHVTKDIAAGLRISLDEAEKLKLYLSHQYRKKWANERRIKLDHDIDISKLNLPSGLKKISYKAVVNGIIQPRLEELFELIAEKVKDSGFADDISGGIVAVGGGAKTIELDKVGKRVTGWTVNPSGPTNLTGLIDDVTEPEFAACVGLLRFSLAHESLSESGSFNLPSFNNLLGGRLNLSRTGQKLTDLLKSLLP